MMTDAGRGIKIKNIAAMFVNEEQLKAYRRALQDVEKTSD